MKLTHAMVNAVLQLLKKRTANNKAPNIKLAEIVMALKARGPFAGYGPYDTERLIGCALQKLKREGRVVLFDRSLGGGAGPGWRWSGRDHSTRNWRRARRNHAA